MPESPDFEKQQIVDALNRKYSTSVPVEVVETAVATGFTSWCTLAADVDLESAAPTLLGHPVRIDSTLCAPNEVWIEGPKGDAVRVWPESETDRDA